jgi:hypothetical protein
MTLIFCNAGLWFSLGPPASSTNKTVHHDITEILLKVALNTLNSNQFNCQKKKGKRTKHFTEN